MANHQALFERSWEQVTASLKLSDAGALRDQLLAAYDAPHRAYHTLEHLAECLLLAEQHLHLAPHPGQLLCALWFHDAVYEVTGQDNEQKSAEWACAALAESGAAQADQEAVYRLIMVTRHHLLAEQEDEKLLVDIDLSILGADPVRFQESNEQIRQEYQWVPAPLYALKRREILESFIARPFIYNTAPFRTAREAQARDNLQGAIAALATGKI